MADSGSWYSPITVSNCEHADPEKFFTIFLVGFQLGVKSKPVFYRYPGLDSTEAERRQRGTPLNFRWANLSESLFAGICITSKANKGET